MCSVVESVEVHCMFEMEVNTATCTCSWSSSGILGMGEGGSEHHTLVHVKGLAVW